MARIFVESTIFSMQGSRICHKCDSVIRHSYGQRQFLSVIHTQGLSVVNDMHRSEVGAAQVSSIHRWR